MKSGPGWLFVNHQWSLVEESNREAILWPVLWIKWTPVLTS